MGVILDVSCGSSFHEGVDYVLCFSGKTWPVPYKQLILSQCLFQLIEFRSCDLEKMNTLAENVTYTRAHRIQVHVS